MSVAGLDDIEEVDVFGDDVVQMPPNQLLSFFASPSPTRQVLCVIWIADSRVILEVGHSLHIESWLMMIGVK